MGHNYIWPNTGIGVAIQVRWSHVNEAKRREADQRITWKRPHIYAVFSLYILNGLLDMAAYSLAPISLLAPTSAVHTRGVALNEVMAHAYETLSASLAPPPSVGYAMHDGQMPMDLCHTPL